MNKTLLADIQQELEQQVDPAPKRSPQSFFKEEVKFHGVKSNLVEKIAKERFQQIKHKSKEEIFDQRYELVEVSYGTARPRGNQLG